jgi:rhodanese-related sulfurtransferase
MVWNRYPDASELEHHMTTTPKAVQERLQSTPTTRLIDVRTPVEFREVHADAAVNIPLDQLQPATVMAGVPDGETVYVICRSGGRAQKACEKFRAAGYTNVVNVEGGTQAWEQAGLPVKRGKKMMSLERQVRIVAGSFVLVGVVLGFVVHPALFGLSGFIGAGLVFAGLTDTCGMGLALAKMPWNRVRVTG